MFNVKKAVIPVAGLGTRFLPITKSIPKEMLPIVDKPNLLYNIEEAVQAGIEDIVLVQGRGKYAIEDFFDVSYELENRLIKDNKTELLNKISHLKDMCNIISVRQKVALGLGHAVHCAKSIVGDENFALLLGDEIMYTEPNKPTVIQQIINSSIENRVSTVAVMKVDETEVNKYGIIDFDKINDHRFKITNVVEKPDLQSAPSNFALPGRYVFTAKIFEHLAESKPNPNGEIYLTDAMIDLAKSQGLEAITFDGTRYDSGDKFGFIKANIEFALRHPEIKDKVKKYIKELKL